MKLQNYVTKELCNQYLLWRSAGFVLRSMTFCISEKIIISVFYEDLYGIGCTGVSLVRRWRKRIWKKLWISLNSLHNQDWHYRGTIKALCTNSHFRIDNEIDFRFDKKIESTNHGQVSFAYMKIPFERLSRTYVI